jgi:hypothetical protein
MSPVRCALEVGQDDTPLLKLSYTVEGRWGLGHLVEEVLRLQSTQPNFGGVRWWFSCPRLLDGKECGRRVGKLYRPLEKRYFACRLCLDLTYESCQELHALDGLLDLMTSGAPDEETAKMGKAAYKALISQTRIEARKRREGTKSILEAFDDFFGEG